MVKKWHIFWAELDPTQGSEQSGRRPVLVISNDISNRILPVVTILPISSVKKNSRIYVTEVLLKKEISSLSKDSAAMIHQIRTISKNRLQKKCGFILDPVIRNRINSSICDFLDLN